MKEKLKLDLLNDLEIKIDNLFKELENHYQNPKMTNDEKWYWLGITKGITNAINVINDEKNCLLEEMENESI